MAVKRKSLHLFEGTVCIPNKSTYMQKMRLPALPVHQNRVFNQTIALFIVHNIRCIMSTTNACYCKHKKLNNQCHSNKKPNRYEEASRRYLDKLIVVS